MKGVENVPDDLINFEDMGDNIYLVFRTLDLKKGWKIMQNQCFCYSIFDSYQILTSSNFPIWFWNMPDPMELVSLPWELFENPFWKKSVTHDNETNFFEFLILESSIEHKDIIQIGHDWQKLSGS